jgi:hypothetical protein
LGKAGLIDNITDSVYIIDNILRSPGINLAEKMLLEQRFTNMITSQSVYLEKQKHIILGE